jgi:glucose/arabinose dehydrogenase
MGRPRATGSESWPSIRRLAFSSDCYLYVASGDAGDAEQAQDADRLGGKQSQLAIGCRA